jgi:hypothetical protein
MRRNVVLVVALTATIGVLTLPATAHAAEFQGTTGQEKPIALVTDEFGLVQLVLVRWTTKCKGNTRRVFSATRFEGPFVGATPFAFDGFGRYTQKGSRGLRYRDFVEIRGELVSETQWAGEFNVRVKVRRNGETVYRCRIPGGGTEWTATEVVPQAAPERRFNAR